MELVAAYLGARCPPATASASKRIEECACRVHDIEQLRQTIEALGELQRGVALARDATRAARRLPLLARAPTGNGDRKRVTEAVPRGLTG